MALAEDFTGSWQEQLSGIPLKAPNIKTSDDLRGFLNDRGIQELAEPLDYLLLTSDATDTEKPAVHLRDPDYELAQSQFVAQWFEPVTRQNHRILYIQSNMARLAGLSLHIPVMTDSYELANGGQISASFSPRLPKGRHRIGHYLKTASIEIGDPAVAVRVQRIARKELLKAASFVEVQYLR